jgi:hypothetical protein
MNAINVIYPYMSEGLWVFDDEKRAIVQEPFVGGADTILDAWTADMPDARQGFGLMFSAGAFPGFQYELDWTRAEMSGNVYRLGEDGPEGWLCPVLLQFFDEPPKKLFVKLFHMSR